MIAPTTPRKDMIMFVAFAAAVLTLPIWMAPLGGSYPDLLQKFAIFGLFAVGFNILFPPSDPNLKQYHCHKRQHFACPLCRVNSLSKQ